MRNYFIALLMFAGTSLNAQVYTEIDTNEVVQSNILTNTSADSTLNHIIKYLKSGDFVKTLDKKAGNIQSLEFVTTDQNDAARSTKLKLNALVKDGKIKEIEINGYVGHIVNLFRGYWQTDFNTSFSQPVTYYRKYGADYILIRTYGAGSNFGRILITDKPKEPKKSS